MFGPVALGLDESDMASSSSLASASVCSPFLPTDFRSSSGQQVRNRSFRSPAERSLNLNSGSSRIVVHLPTPCLLTPRRRWFVSSSDHFRLGLGQTPLCPYPHRECWPRPHWNSAVLVLWEMNSFRTRETVSSSSSSIRMGGKTSAFGGGSWSPLMMGGTTCCVDFCFLSGWGSCGNPPSLSAHDASS